MNAFELLQEAKSDEIDKWRGEYLLPVDGFMYMGHKFDLQVSTYTNASAVAGFTALIGGVPPGFTWIDFDNNPVPMNSEEFVGFAVIVAERLQYAYAHSSELKVIAQNATTVEELNAIAW